MFIAKTIGYGTICLANLLLFAIVSFSILVGWYYWDSSENRGYTFGYYGEFNTIVSALETIPDIEIVFAGGNHDLSFEEIVIDVKMSNEKVVCLLFGEQDPIREMSGDLLIRAIREKIERDSIDDRTWNRS